VVIEKKAATSAIVKVLRMAAHDGGAEDTGRVRKPPMEETAGGVWGGGASELWDLTDVVA